MFHQLKNRNFYLMLAADMVLFGLALFGAYLIRFDFILSEENLGQSLNLLPFVLLVKFAAFFSFGLYRGMWRYSSLSDIWRLLQATALSSLIIIFGILFLHHFHGYSRGVFLIDAGLTFLFTGGLRIGVRFLYHEGILERKNGSEIAACPRSNRMPIIIIGAGDAGEMALREILENRAKTYEVVGLVDDDPGKRKRLIHGVPVRGTINDLPRLAKKFCARELIIAIPSATGHQMRRIVRICESCGMLYKTLPGINEIIGGRVSVKTLRDVSYKDLLRRKPVKLELEAISAYVKGQRVLVTGAGGSIGSELCRQIFRFEPEQMLLLDSSEANLYAIQMELEHHFRYTDYTTILENVQHRSALEEIMQRYDPQIVVHAAAYKHVPMMEWNPWEAIFNNIIGTRHVMESSVAHGVRRFVMVSTDKAVRPTNVMGASKRICELMMQGFEGENGTKMMCVRFGNVVGSSGSVIPLFRKQIEHGGPVTVTHPEVTRYFMTIPEACQLILQAGAMGDGGEVFILEMGEPVRIADMACDLIRLCGKEPDRDIEIMFTGLRPGEKLYEELITEGEGIVRTAHEKIMVLRPNGKWNGQGDRDSFNKWLDQNIKELEGAAARHDGTAIRQKLKKIVPEYHPENNGHAL